ncbi:MAG: cytochrome c oxidase subunit 4, partial [Methylobacterium sp.]
GGAAALGFLGLAIGIWMFAIAMVVFIIAITGWVYEYYRGYHAR